MRSGDDCFVSPSFGTGSVCLFSSSAEAVCGTMLGPGKKYSRCSTHSPILSLIPALTVSISAVIGLCFGVGLLFFTNSVSIVAIIHFVTNSMVLSTRSFLAPSQDIVLLSSCEVFTVLTVILASVLMLMSSQWVQNWSGHLVDQSDFVPLVPESGDLLKSSLVSSRSLPSPHRHRWSNRSSRLPPDREYQSQE